MQLQFTKMHGAGNDFVMLDLITQRYILRPRDVRLRMAVASHDRHQVEALLDEVEALYLNGPAGGGGIRLNISARTATVVGAVRQNEAVSRGYLLEDTP